MYFNLNFLDYFRKKNQFYETQLIVRAKHLDLITLTQYENLMKKLSQQGYRTAEPLEKKHHQPNKDILSKQ